MSSCRSTDYANLTYSAGWFLCDYTNMGCLVSNEASNDGEQQTSCSVIQAGDIDLWLLVLSGHCRYRGLLNVSSGTFINHSTITCNQAAWIGGSKCKLEAAPSTSCTVDTHPWETQNLDWNDMCCHSKLMMDAYPNFASSCVHTCLMLACPWKQSKFQANKWPSVSPQTLRDFPAMISHNEAKGCYSL